MIFILTITLHFQWIISPKIPFGDDNSAHYAVAIHISEVIKEGKTDFWWHQSNLGIPLFAAYQPLPSMFMGLSIAAFESLIHPISLFKGSIILIWASMPFAWYVGFRWYGLPRNYCVFLGLLTLCFHDPYSVGFGIRSSTFKGLYTQHFGLFFLPLFVGSFAQMLQSTQKSTLNTAVLFSLTAMSHLWVGLYAGIIALSLSISQFQSTKNHYQKLLKFSFFVCILLAWWILPLLLTNEYAGGLPWLRSFQNGWTWQKIFENFFTGEIFDHSRLPVLTVLCTI